MESALRAYLKDVECEANIASNKHETDATHLSLQLKGEHGGRSRKKRNKDEKKTNIEEIKGTQGEERRIKEIKVKKEKVKRIRKIIMKRERKRTKVKKIIVRESETKGT
jgi:hypothetical protein